VQEVASSNLVAPTSLIAPGLVPGALLSGNAMRFLPLLLLLCAACGSGDQPGPELLWLPDYSTPEKATETYIRALETGDLDLAVTATIPEEREITSRSIGELLARAREQGVSLRISVKEGTAIVDEDRAWLAVTLTPVDAEGKPKKFIPPGASEARGEGSALFAFARQPGGDWRYSPILSAEIANPPASDTPPEPENE
jgi:hypothetical protein